MQRNLTTSCIFLASCSDNVLLCGDLNCKGPDGTQVDDGLALLLSSLGLEQMIHMPNRGSASLDVLASDAPDIFTDVRVIDAGLLSDHRLLLVSCFINRRATRAAPTSYRNIKKISFQHFKAPLRNSTIFHLQKQLSIHLHRKLLLRSPRRSTKLLPLSELATDDCQRQRPSG